MTPDENTDVRQGRQLQAPIRINQGEIFSFERPYHLREVEFIKLTQANAVLGAVGAGLLTAALPQLVQNYFAKSPRPTFEKFITSADNLTWLILTLLAIFFIGSSFLTSKEKRQTLKRIKDFYDQNRNLELGMYGESDVGS